MTPELERAIAAQAAAWRWLDLGAAHLAVALRATCGDTAAFWACVRLGEWAKEVLPVELAERADELVAEAGLHAAAARKAAA